MDETNSMLRCELSNRIRVASFNTGDSEAITWVCTKNILDRQQRNLGAQQVEVGSRWKDCSLAETQDRHLEPQTSGAIADKCIVLSTSTEEGQLYLENQCAHKHVTTLVNPWFQRSPVLRFLAQPSVARVVGSECSSVHQGVHQLKAKAGQYDAVCQERPQT